MKTELLIPDPHSHFQHHNRRAEYLGKLINDVKPDIVRCIGDLWDMPSLSSYEKGKKSFQGRTYSADINAGLDFNHRLWDTVRGAKRKLPFRVFHIGNHEHRITKAIDLQPELEGTISLKDLCLDEFYDQVIPYNGRNPGVDISDGLHYAHYFISGVLGKPLGGLHPAYSILTKGMVSATAGDLHLLDYRIATTLGGRKVQGLVAGCFLDFDLEWAGESNRLWWRGVIVKRNVSDGNYDPQFISMDALRREYS